MNKVFALTGVGGVAMLGLSSIGVAQQSPAGADPASGSLDEVVVTANKREESLQRVGLTVTAISANQLAEQRITSLQDVAAAVPGLAFAPTPSNTPIFTLRGIGYNGNSLGAYPAVSIYVDQAPLPFPVMASHSAYDLERIEVLKGPQGTIFGENSTGGAINYIAAKPTNHFEAGGDISYGNYNAFQENAFVSGPLADNLRARLSVNASNQDGWQYSVTRPNDKNGQQSYFAGRLITDWDATSAVRFSLNLNGWVDKSPPQAAQLVAMIPQVPATVQPGQLTVPFPPSNPRAADWGPATPTGDRTFIQAALRTDIDLPHDIALTSLTNYADFTQKQVADVDGTPLAIEDLIKDDGDIHTFTQELRFAGKGDAYRWLVGGNFEKSETFEDQVTDYSNDSQSNAANLYISESGTPVRQDLTNIAGFFNGEYDISPQFTMHAGARYTSTKDEVNICSYSPGNGNVATLFNILGDLLGKVPFTPIGPTGCYTLNQNMVPGEPFVSSLKQGNVSWRVGLDYKATDDTLVYGNISRGYKAGSFPSLSASTFVQLQPVSQESVTAYEAGVKTMFWDHRARLNAAVFYYDYKDKQIEGKEADQIFHVLNILVNVPKSRVLGVDADLTVEPVKGLTLGSSVTYLDSRIQEYTGIDVLGNTANFAGQSLPFTPTWSGRVNAEYRHVLPNGAAPFAGLSVSGQTSSTTVPGGNYVTIPASSVNRVYPGDTYPFETNSYAVIDAQLGYEATDGRWKVMLWGKNLTNKYYWTNVVASNDAIGRYAGRPATYGITVGFKIK